MTQIFSWSPSGKQNLAVAAMAHHVLFLCRAWDVTEGIVRLCEVSVLGLQSSGA